MCETNCNPLMKCLLFLQYGPHDDLVMILWRGRGRRRLTDFLAIVMIDVVIGLIMLIIRKL